MKDQIIIKHIQKLKEWLSRFDLPTSLEEKNSSRKMSAERENLQILFLSKVYFKHEANKDLLEMLQDLHPNEEVVINDLNLVTLDKDMPLLLTQLKEMLVPVPSKNAK